MKKLAILIFSFFLIGLLVADPTFDSNQTNNTFAGQPTLFSINVNDGSALNPNGAFIFSTNNTGIWVNDSAVYFTSTPSWANITKILNSNPGIFVGYRWYFNNSEGSFNSTPIYLLETNADAIFPISISNSANNTLAGQITKFSINVNDNLALNPNGAFIFSTNNTGIWVNDSAVYFTSTPSWANITKILNSTAGILVGYRWYFNDSAGNLNFTSLFTLNTTIDLTSPTYSSKSVNSTTAGEIAKFSINVNDNLALNPNGQYIFSTNNSGWSNDSAVNFTSTPSTISSTKVLSSTVGKIIGYRWYFTDSSGNKNSTPIYVLKTEEEEEDDGAGGDTGGDEENVVIYRPTTQQLKNGFDVFFKINDIIRINLSNITNSTYLIQIKDVDRLLNNITLSLEESNYSVLVNQTLKINLDKDNFYDLQVYASSITYLNSTRLIFKEINEEIPLEVREAVKANSTINSTNSSAHLQTQGFSDTKKKNPPILYIFGGIVLLAAAGIGIWIIKRIKRYREYGY